MEARSPQVGRHRDGGRERMLEAARSTANISGRGGSDWKRQTHFWLRWAHVYISMFSLLVMLFFGITGITLNHPGWVFSEPSTTTVSGVLPAAAFTDQGVEFLTVSEFIRQQHGVTGEVVDFGVDEGGEGTISYRGPGTTADLFFQIPGGQYELNSSEADFIATMNALHQGRDAGSLWRWIIDISGLLLVVIALTGLGIQFFLRKRRVSALTLSVVGAVLTVVLIWLALG